jgi:hypothetical protein
MLRQPGTSRDAALAALSSASLAEVEPHLPFLNGLFSGDETAWVASVLTHIYAREQAWPRVAELISHASQQARLGALRALDDIAEAGASLEPIVPALLECFEVNDADSTKQRVAAARVLTWLVLRHREQPQTLILHGVDILSIVEVRSELKAISRLAKKMKDDR